MQQRLSSRRPPPPSCQPPQGSSIGVIVPGCEQHKDWMRPPHPDDALTAPNTHPSAGLRALGTSNHSGVPASPPALFSRSPPLPAESTVLSVQSNASGSASRIGLRDVAELVRHLAESRCMTRQLQRRVLEMESSFTVHAVARDDSVISDVPAQRNTSFAVPMIKGRLATSGEERAPASAEQAVRSHDHIHQPPISKSRRRPDEGRDGESARSAAPATPKVTKGRGRVLAMSCPSRSCDSFAFRNARHRTSPMASSLTSSVSTTVSAATNSLPNTSPPSTISDSPVRRASFSPYSRGALGGVSSRGVSRHGPQRGSQHGRVRRRARSAPERTIEWSLPGHTHTHTHTHHCDAAADVLRRLKKKCRRDIADRHRTRTRSRGHRHHGRHDTDINTTSSVGGRDGAQLASRAAPVSMHRYGSRCLPSEWGRHRHVRNALADMAHLASLPSSLSPAAASRLLGESRDSSSKKKKALMWQRRYYDLLARYTDERMRRDSDLADIHEMIECISSEQDSFRHHRVQRHHALPWEDDAAGNSHISLQGGAAPPESASGVLDGTKAASTSDATAAPPAAAASSLHNGIMRNKDDVCSPGGGPVPETAAATLGHESLECIEALRSEADTWRQRCLDLMQQRRQLDQQMHEEVTLASDASIAPLPPRPSVDAGGQASLKLGAAPIPRRAELLTGVNTSNRLDEEVCSVAEGGCSGRAGVGSASETNLLDNGQQRRASWSRIPSDPSTPLPRVGQVTEHLPSTTTTAVDQLCHPYAPPRSILTSTTPLIRAPHYNETSLTPPAPLPLSPSSFVQRSAQSADFASLPPARFSRPWTPSWSPLAAKPALFVGLPGYQQLSPHHDLRGASLDEAGTSSPPPGRVFPSRVGIDCTTPTTTTGLGGPPFLDAGGTMARGNAGRDGIAQDHGHAARGIYLGQPDATVESQRRIGASYLPTPASGAPMPYQPVSAPLHTSSPLSRAAELRDTREMLERDIRRHDQLLAAIGKLQRTAAEHAARRGV